MNIPNHWQPTNLRLTTGVLTRAELLPIFFSPMTCCFAMVLIQSLKSRPASLFPFYFGSGLVASIVANTLFVMTGVLARVYYQLNITAVEFRFTVITAVAFVARSILVGNVLSNSYRLAKRLEQSIDQSLESCLRLELQGHLIVPQIV
jgi:hypothetical protein